MSIHHTIKKKLEAAGVTIDPAPEGSQGNYVAFWQARDEDGKVMLVDSVEFFHDDPKVLAAAMLAAKMAVLEHHLSFEQDTVGAVQITVGIKNPREVGHVADLADLPSSMADVLEALTDSEADEIVEADAAEAEEEERKGGSVVPDVFKKRYAEAGHPGTCGDWLAFALDPLVTTNGKLDPDAMQEVARLNGVDVSNLNRTTPGWQGRFRMTARNLLVKKVGVAGFLLVPSVEGDPAQLPAPAEWLAANQPKIKEPGDKKSARKTKGA